MNYNGRAVFTILQSKGHGVPPWILEDYRVLPLEDVFRRLEVLGLYLDKESLRLYADECGSPEELADLLVGGSALRDQIYLLLFEAWRKACPDSQSISLFCDELDHVITLYEQEMLEDEEPLQKQLAELESVLEGEADKGRDPREVFEAIASYSYHSLEAFLYDYIAAKIDAGHDTYSSELIDGFKPYLKEPIWFDLLRVRLLAQDEAKIALDRLYEAALEKGDVNFLLEALRVSMYIGTSFLDYARALLPLLQEEDRDEFRSLVRECCPDKGTLHNLGLL